MKKIILAIGALFLVQLLPAQLNVSYVGQLEYDVVLSDIWGYAAPDGTEYALVGIENGFSIVSLADPANPTELHFIPGDETIWRDIKTWGNFAFVTADAVDDGLLVVDMTGLPNSIDWYYWNPPLMNEGPLENCHNIWIDEFGWAYLSGCNINGGGVLFLDVHTDPYNPVFAGAGDNRYAHDVWSLDNIMYTSDLGSGLNITEVSDKNNIQLLATQFTPFNFTHNAWATDDNHYVFTTDEVANAPVASYDVSNLNDIQELDQFVPTTTLGDGVVPHNVHVWNEFLIISYYSDGCIIVDASRPDNLIEVGNFDTHIPASTGFNGAWGAYPYLPSGLILVSDRGAGLFVLEPNYVNACYLEGKVTDASTSNNISNVEIKIQSTDPNLTNTDNFGDYKTGQATAGTYDVLFTKSGYEPLTTQAQLVNGEVTILNVQMNALVPITITGTVISEETGNPVPDAAIFAQSVDGEYSAITGSDGTYSITGVFEGDFNFFAGAWGYLHEVDAQFINDTNTEVSFILKKGYQDDFILDLDWLAYGDASTGIWERGEPVGTFTGNGNASNTDEDIQGDIGDHCYVTGNDGGGAGNDDIDDGETILRSPIMDLSSFNQPIVSYYTWFLNAGGQSTPDDSLTVTVSNGMEEVVLEVISDSDPEWRPQSVFILSEYIDITDHMRIIFTAGDYDNPHLVEAAVDAFLVVDGMPNSTENLLDENISLSAFPNPFNENVTIEFDLERSFDRAELKVYNLLGQPIQSIPLTNISDKVNINTNWEVGIYFVQVEVDGKLSQTVKLVKQ